ncbi:MAG: glucosaminidase domain-containing protein [Bacteroidetes bacterium]|nr:glucosaminidase domain-containing protein [Bacteroidota bacterium]
MKVILALFFSLTHGLLFFTKTERLETLYAALVYFPVSIEKMEDSSKEKLKDTVAVPAEQDVRLALLDSIFNYICASEILHKDIVIKQVIWETGWLKGQYLMSRNNLFGFRVKEYLRFSSWQESVDYYQKWQKTYYRDPKENYYQFLLRINYSNSRYPGHLKSVKYLKSCS